MNTKMALSVFSVLPPQFSCLSANELTAGELTYQQRNADCLPGCFLCKSPFHSSIKLFQSIYAKISKCARNRQKDSLRKGHILALGTGYHPWPKGLC